MRLRSLELLRDGDRTVGELRELTELDSSSASQHLAALRRHGMVEGVKEGTSVRYSVRDPLMFQLLETARQIISASLAETKALLEELSVPERVPDLPKRSGPTR
jgi:ArsR family transcriptional regulator